MVGNWIGILQLFLPWMLTVVGAVVWGARLEGRINAHDLRFTERGLRFDAQHQDLCERLERIERKLDNEQLRFMNRE